MTIRAQCPGCGKFSKAPDEYVGRIEKCPACGVSMVIRSSAANETVATVSPPATAAEPEPTAPFVEIDTRPQSSGSKPTRTKRTILLPLVVTGGICLLAGFLIAILIRASGPKSEERRPVSPTAESKRDNPINVDVEGLQATIDELRHRNESLILDSEKSAVQSSRDDTATRRLHPQPPSKGLSGQVDGASFSYENLNWRLADSGLELTGDMRNETGKDWYSAVFQVSLYDASNRLAGTTWFYMTNVSENSTALFTAHVPDFENDPDDIHVRMRFQAGSNAQQVDPALHRFTSDAGSLDIEAKIVDFQNGEVWLKRPNGKRIKVKLDLLSEGNKAFVKQWIAENQSLKSHRFTSDSGLFDVEAKIVDFQDGVVTLERPNGGQVKVKLDFLSEGNQAFVQQWIAENQKPVKSNFKRDSFVAGRK